VSIATAVRRVVADEDMLPRLVASIAAFVVFSVASGLAQWYVATLHVSPTTASGQASLIFRVAMPVVIDLSSMLYLSIMKVKSLKRYLAEQARDAGGDRAGEPEPPVREASPAGAHQAKQQHDQYMHSLEATQQVVIDLQRLITGHIVATATAALTGRPGGEALVQALPAAGEAAEGAKATIYIQAQVREGEHRRIRDA
jgi:hypothetical protein